MVRDSRSRARSRRKERGNVAGLSAPPPKGGRFAPLNPGQVKQVTDAAFEILAEIGMAGTPEPYRSLLIDRGRATVAEDRLRFPRSAVEDAIARTPSRVSLPGFVEDRGLDIGGGHVHIGTGGAAVQVLDAEMGSFRDAKLADLYALMRILEDCENIHYGVRPTVARDMTRPFELDVNTAFACLKATTKPIGISFDNAEHVEPIVGLFDIALGEGGAFRTQPFCFGVIVHVVPPLRFAEEGCAVMTRAIQAGMPLQICSAGQAGATSPASLAGTLAQGLAESLAGLMLVDAIQPGHPCIFAFMPFISDLRTGAMSGGGGEAAVACGAAAQLLLNLDLPSTASAGMTDSKIADAQAGYEKGYSVVLAAQAGADMINLSVGMLGSIMVASPEALVIDNEMCGAVLRAVRGIEVSDDLLNLEVIRSVVSGDGHYLGQSQTLELMTSEYVYPRLGDRQSVDDWLESGETSIWDRARIRVGEILSQDGAEHLSKSRRSRDPTGLSDQTSGGTLMHVFRSMIIEAPIESVWIALRRFDGVAAWNPGVTKAEMLSGDPTEIGAVRRLEAADGSLWRETLLDHSDREYFYSYDIVEGPLPVWNYLSKHHLIPVTHDNTTLSIWEVTFDCAAEDEAEMGRIVGDGIFIGGMLGLNSFVKGR